MTGVYGKLPAHGDFVRRGLPQSFVEPWDAWLQSGLAAAQAALGADFGRHWSATPAWRFHLPAGCCGPDTVTGVLMPSMDTVGRRFPLTLAALLEIGDGPPAAAWFDMLEGAAVAARDRGDGIETLTAGLPAVPVGGSGVRSAETAWWTADGRRVAAPSWPSAAHFVALLGASAGLCRPVARAASHAGGVRSRNEDAFVERPDIGLWAVADGAGGHGAGDVASTTACAALRELPAGLSAGEVLAQARLRLAQVHAELQLHAATAAGLTPVTTIVVLMVRDEHFACLWAGDSRAYLLRDGALLQLTKDHSLLQQLLDAGTLGAEDAERHPHANVITRAVGGPDALVLDKVAGRLLPGDRVLLCSDGLYKALSESRIAAVLAGDAGAQELIDACLRAGASDNVTAVVVDV